MSSNPFVNVTQNLIPSLLAQSLLVLNNYTVFLAGLLEAFLEIQTTEICPGLSESKLIEVQLLSLTDMNEMTKNIISSFLNTVRI